LLGSKRSSTPPRILASQSPRDEHSDPSIYSSTDSLSSLSSLAQTLSFGAIGGGGGGGGKRKSVRKSKAQDSMITMAVPTSLTQLNKSIEQLRHKIAKVKRKNEAAKIVRLRNQRKISIARGKFDELQVQKNSLSRRCDFLLNDASAGRGKKNRSRPNLAVLNECFFIALSDDGSMGVICGER